MRARWVVTIAAVMSIACAGVASASTHTSARKHAPAKPKRYVRTTTEQYSGGSSVWTSTPVVRADAQPTVAPPSAPILDITFIRTDRFLSIASVDKTGRPLSMTLWTAGWGTSTATSQLICGSVNDLPVPAGAGDYHLTINAASADSTCPGTATTGSVTVAISNLR